MALDAGGGAGRGPSARPGVAGSTPLKPAAWMRGSELTSAARVPASQPGDARLGPSSGPPSYSLGSGGNLPKPGSSFHIF